MTDLNNAAALRQLDSLKMIDMTLAYPEQYAQGFAIGESAPLPQRPERVDEIVILGTGGGSGAAANLLAAYLFDRTPVPIISIQGYNAPAYVDQNSIVFAVSHSGKTEEIRAAAKQARERGALVIGLGAGGALHADLTTAGLPYLTVPGGMMPRIVVGYIMMPILALLWRWGLAPDPRTELKAATDLMAALAPKYGPESPVEANRAKQIALKASGKIPVIYGFADHYGAVAWRIKNQLGENSKYMAFWNQIPHLHHDEAVGWDMEPELCQQLSFLLLRDKEAESPQMATRWAATTEILEERMGAVETVWAEGEGRLARMLSLVFLGDFFTIYMAMAKGVDPTPVAVIDLFKKKVGQ